MGLLMTPTLSLAAVSAPLNLSIVGTISGNDATPTFTWQASAGATWYDYRLDNGGYLDLANVYSITLPTLANGYHTIAVRAHNNYNEVSSETTLTFEIDTVGPTVPLVNQYYATEDKALTISVNTSGESLVSSCTLYVSSVSVGTMSAGSNGLFTKIYTFVNPGSFSVYTSCIDGDNNTSVGGARTVTVSPITATPIPTPTVSSGSADEGDLIKTTCGSKVLANDPCKTVYYWGTDNKRHTFPNEAVFFSWYNDFDDVVEVTTSFMSSLVIGENVTIKPGTTTIKFASSAEVYAVAEGAVLRHYLTPALVVADYGSDWYGADLVTVSDVFFDNYSIGTVIDSSSDYNPNTAESGVTSIDDNF